MQVRRDEFTPEPSNGTHSPGSQKTGLNLEKKLTCVNYPRHSLSGEYLARQTLEGQNSLARTGYLFNHIARISTGSNFQFILKLH
jgi:hypothetical protein